MVKQTIPQTSATPPALPQRGVAGVIGAIMAGAAVGLFAWLGLIKSSDYILLSGVVLLIPVPLFMVGLGVGRGDMLVAALVSIAVLAVKLNTEVMFLLTGVYILPVVMICLLALLYRHDNHGDLFWYPAGRIITAITLYPLAAYGCFSVMLGEHGVEKFLYQNFLPIFESWAQSPKFQEALMQSRQFAHEVTQEQAGILADVATRNFVFILPGMLILSWIVMIVVSGLWAQFALMSNKMALRPTPRLDDFEVPSWLLPLFAIMILLAKFYGGEVAYFARNTLLAFIVPYFVLGASIFHMWAAQTRHKILMLVLFYTFMGLAYPVAFVALAGVLEPWLHLRRRIQSKMKPST